MIILYRYTDILLCSTVLNIYIWYKEQQSQHLHISFCIFTSNISQNRSRYEVRQVAWLGDRFFWGAETNTACLVLINRD